MRGADFSVFLPFLTRTDPFKVIEARTDEGLVQITGNMITFDVGSDFDNMSVGQSTQVIVDVDVALDGAFYATYPMTLTVTMTDEGLEVEDEYGRTGLGQLTTYGVPLDKFLQEGIGFGPIGATLIDINTDDIKEALAGDLKLARDFALASLQAAEADVVEAQAALSAAETKL